ncbi:putative ribosome-binding factor A, mitochondrial isoform X2 [Artibeus jamaicensis]|uniref:putative ribosome-binding factor A, mitochondrial isoform X2 n=1 Tax=Artibeus jamaicensis TaxID=9417 RepID=UPI00235A6ABD|nr:putative ribosome-binding factor A, mitochondrial isoform X2 [Artibeus jamaicensis]
MWVAAPRVLGVSPGLRALLGRRHAGLLPSGARGLHSSPVPCGKNLLKKFASKTKKKFWYEGPSLGSHLTHKPSQLDFLTKSTSRKTKKEDHVRLRALNGLLYKALTDLLCTPEVSQEVYNLNVELSKVSLTADFSACRVYWKTPLPAEQNADAQATLQRHAARMRWIGYWQSLISDRQMKTLYARTSGTLRPQKPPHYMTPPDLPWALICAGLITRLSTSRLRSTRGGRRKGAGACLGLEMITELQDKWKGGKRPGPTQSRSSP